MARLVQKAGEDQITHELLFNITSVGWGALNDVVIPDPGEKRVHAEIVSLGRHRYAVRDLCSAGGLTVNGEAVSGLRELAAGDALRVGPAEFIYDADSAETANEAEKGQSIGRR